MSKQPITTCKECGKTMRGKYQVKTHLCPPKATQSTQSTKHQS